MDFVKDLPHTKVGFVNVAVYSSTGDAYVYTEATLLPVFNSHMGPQCIMGVGGGRAQPSAA